MRRFRVVRLVLSFYFGVICELPIWSLGRLAEKRLFIVVLSLQLDAKPEAERGGKLGSPWRLAILLMPVMRWLDKEYVMRRTICVRTEPLAW